MAKIVKNIGKELQGSAKHSMLHAAKKGKVNIITNAKKGVKLIHTVYKNKNQPKGDRA